MKRYLFLCSVPLITVGTIILASMAYRSQLNSDISSIDSSLPNNPINPNPGQPIVPDKPVTPEPDKPTNPDKPIIPEPDHSTNPGYITYHFKDDQELVNIINSLYKNELKSEIVEQTKNDIVSSNLLPLIGVTDINDCNIVLPESLSLSNIQFEIKDNVYKIRSIKNLSVKVISKKDDGQSLDLVLEFFDEKWDIYNFVKQ